MRVTKTSARSNVNEELTRSKTEQTLAKNYHTKLTLRYQPSYLKGLQSKYLVPVSMFKRSHLAGTVALVTFCFAAEKTVAQVEVPESSLAEFCSKLPRPEWADVKRLNVSEALTRQWFEVYEVAPGVTAIYEPFQWQEVISYLIQGEHKALLFDTGNGLGDISALVTSLTDKPIAVLNSHTHYDHVGGNHAFDTIYGMNTEYTRASQKGVANEDVAIEASPSALCRELPEGVSQESHVGNPFKVTHFLEAFKKCSREMLRGKD